MTKFNKLSLKYQAIKIYLLSLLASLLFYYPFDKLYIYIFQPAMFGGDLYLAIPGSVEVIINGALFSFYFFLPFFVFLLIQGRQYLIWFIGAVIPLLIALVGGTKDILWALILSVLGWGLAKGILLIKKKK